MLKNNNYTNGSIFVFTVILLMALCFFMSFALDRLPLKFDLSGIDFYFLQSWRMLSAHLAHYSWQHLALNVFSLFVLRVAFSVWPSAIYCWSFLFFSGLFISVGLRFSHGFLHDLDFYLGFSGVFHGLILVLLLFNRTLAPGLYALVAFGLIVKVLVEQVTGSPSMLSDFIQLPVATEAHMLGLLSGAIFYCISVCCGFLSSRKVN